MFAWAKLSGCFVKWPVKVLEIGLEKSLVFCKCDNAEIYVKNDHLLHFDGQIDLTTSGVCALKKKGLCATLSCFEKDCDWAKSSYKTPNESPQRSGRAATKEVTESTCSSTPKDVTTVDNSSGEPEVKRIKTEIIERQIPATSNNIKAEHASGGSDSDATVTDGDGEYIPSMQDGENEDNYPMLNKLETDKTPNESPQRNGRAATKEVTESSSTPKDVTTVDNSSGEPEVKSIWTEIIERSVPATCNNIKAEHASGGSDSDATVTDSDGEYIPSMQDGENEDEYPMMNKLDIAENKTPNESPQRNERAATKEVTESSSTPKDVTTVDNSSGEPEVKSIWTEIIERQIPATSNNIKAEYASGGSKSEAITVTDSDGEYIPNTSEGSENEEKYPMMNKLETDKTPNESPQRSGRAATKEVTESSSTPKDVTTVDNSSGEPEVKSIWTEIIKRPVPATCNNIKAEHASGGSDSDATVTDSDGEYIPNTSEGSESEDVYPMMNKLETGNSNGNQGKPVMIEEKNPFDDCSPASEGEIESDEDTPPEKTILRASDKPMIFIRKVLKSTEKKTEQKKIKTRVYNSYHCCTFCSMLVQHIPVHIQTHLEIPEVKALFKDAKANETGPDFNMIRARGDDQHNHNVVEKAKGELLLSRRPVGSFKAADYGPCPNCREWMLLTTIARHQTTCKERTERKSKKVLLLNSDILAGRIKGSPSKILQDEVFSIMLRDEISTIAQSDPLIVCLGESWLRNNIDNKSKRKYYTSQHMRACARLLMELRKEDADTSDSFKSMADYLTPSNFDGVVQASLQLALPDIDDEADLKAPSNAIKIKYDIQKMVNAKWALLVKQKVYNPDEVQNCKVFLELIKVQWLEKVTKLARSILEERKFVKNIQIPSPEDVEKLTKHILNEISKLDLKKISSKTYQRAVILAEARLLAYNKRRTGEIEVINLKTYVGRTKHSDDVQESILMNLSPVEEHLLKSQQMMTVRGKRGRGVPVIIPGDISETLEYLATPTNREAAGILVENKFLFPNSRLGYGRAYDSLQTVAQECGAQIGARMTSVSLRKYTATLTQVLNMEGNQLQWLCDHLGHTKKVHLQHYRQLSGFIERVHISKLMLIQDNNLTKKFAGQKLDEIDISEIVFGETVCNEEPVDEPQIDEEEIDDEQIDDEPICMDEESFVTKKKKKNTRIRWTEEEEMEIQKFLGEFIKKKTTPGKKECLKAIQKSKANKGILQRRHWHTIVKKISAMKQKSMNLKEES